MTIASGIFKKVAYKAEATWGTAPATSGGTYLRRVTSNLNLVKNTYESGEIRTDQQVYDFRHGARRVEGTISGEMSVGAYQAFIEAMLRSASSTVGSIGAQSTTFGGSADAWTFTSTSSLITAGIRVGSVVVMTGGATTANMNRNFLVTGVSSNGSTGTFVTTDRGTVTSGASTATVITSPGKRVVVPSTGHTNVSFSIEEWHGDVNLSRVYLGCKPTQMALKLPATGMATVDFSFLGADIKTPLGSVQFFPDAQCNAATTGGSYAAVNGIVAIGGTPIGLITGLDMTVVGGHTVGQVVGANTTPDVFPGRVRVTGQMTMYLQDATYLNGFINETEFSILAVLESTQASNSPFTSIFLPRCKAGSATADDGEKGIILTIPFTALRSSATVSSTSIDDTTIAIQDSAWV